MFQLKRYKQRHILFKHKQYKQTRILYTRTWNITLHVYCCLRKSIELI